MRSAAQLISVVPSLDSVIQSYLWIKCMFMICQIWRTPGIDAIVRIDAVVKIILMYSHAGGR
jgi:hypothetical protein